jgi:2'-5' RNA ligase
MNDIFGTTPDRYSIAVHTPEDLTEKIMVFRADIGLADLTSEPHISISSSLHNPVDLDNLKTRIQNMATKQHLFRIHFNTPAFGGGGAWGGLSVTLTDDLQTLHDAVMQTIRGAITYSDDHSYHPHVTIFQSATPEESQKGPASGPQIDFGTGFDISSIELVGRLGPLRGGTRTIIESFPIG